MGAGGMCQACGKADQPCCSDGTSCEMGLGCLRNPAGNKCGTCGGAGQPCCGGGNNGSCQMGFACTGRDMTSPGMCQTCGGMGQPCCSGNMACQTGLGCVAGATGNTCGTCGGMGQPCCGTGGGGTCTMGLGCGGR